MRSAVWVCGLLLVFGCKGGSGFTGATGKAGGKAPSESSKKPDVSQPESTTAEPSGDASSDQPGSANANGKPAAKPLSPTPPSAEPVAEDDPLANIDSACTTLTSGLFDGIAVTPEQSPLARTAPVDCRSGIEFNNLKHASFDLASAGGSRAITLELDIASYSRADRMKILADGKLMLDTCRLRTAKYIDPTNGAERPPEDSIRYFRVTLPAGVRTLSFDFGGATSPTYMKVVGLCDFAATATNVSGRDPELRPAAD